MILIFVNLQAKYLYKKLWATYNPEGWKKPIDRLGHHSQQTALTKLWDESQIGSTMPPPKFGFTLVTVKNVGVRLNLEFWKKFSGWPSKVSFKANFFSVSFTLLKLIDYADVLYSHMQWILQNKFRWASWSLADFPLMTDTYMKGSNGSDRNSAYRSHSVNSNTLHCTG